MLDVGCGYGPIGLAMKEHDPASVLHMVDRDALAVAFATENSRRNGWNDVEAYGSLVYDDVRPGHFDLVLSNIPGKGTPALHRHWLLEAGAHLSDDGVVAVVVVRPLAPTVAQILAQVPDVLVLLHEEHSTHSIFHYRFRTPCAAGATAMDSNVFSRGTVPIDVAGVGYELQTVYGLPEFDSLTFSSSLTITALRDLGQAVHRAGCLNPGQGHTAIALWRLFRPDHLTIVDRDLLALRATRANLVRNGCPADRLTLVHGLGLDATIWSDLDLVVDNLRPKEPPEATNQRIAAAASAISAGGQLFIGGTSTAVTRALRALETLHSASVVGRRRSNRYSVVSCRRR